MSNTGSSNIYSMINNLQIMDKKDLKFKIGDVVTYDGITNYTIKSIDDYCYHLSVGTFIPFRNQDAFKLVESSVANYSDDNKLSELCDNVIEEDKRFYKFKRELTAMMKDLVLECCNGTFGYYSEEDVDMFAEKKATQLFNIASSSKQSGVDYKKLKDLLDDALSKETAESWNERLKLRELADDNEEHLGWLDDANALEDEKNQKVWHNADEEKPISDVEVVCVNYDGNWHTSRLSECDDDEVETWAYINVLLNPDLRYASRNDNLEEVITKELENYFGISRAQYEKCYSEEDMKNIARYMAKWQKQQDDSIPQELIDAYKANVEAGNKNKTPDYLEGFFDGTQSMQKIADKCADDTTKMIDEAYEDGRTDMKQELLKDAVDLTVRGDAAKDNEPYLIFVPDVRKFEVGDKVKCIIVKDE